MLGRATCYGCWKPESLCLCDRIRIVANRTEILILQHPRERRHPLGTARIARLGLERAKLEVAGSGNRMGVHRPIPVSEGAALLYPKDPTRPDCRARDIADLEAGERPTQLIVLDGTWAHANRLYLENPWLRALPHLGLTPSRPSRYRIRKPPKAQYISTLESIVEALQILEPETVGLTGLIEVFDSMIDDQIRIMRRCQGQPGSGRRPLRKIARQAERREARLRGESDDGSAGPREVHDGR